MSEHLYWNPNTLMLPRGGGLFRLFQVNSRRNLLVSRGVIDLADQLSGGADREAVMAWCAASGAVLRVADATAFTLWDNAYRNSDFFDAEVGPDELETLPAAEVLELLQDCGIVSDCWPPRIEQDKRHFGDRFRGSFHEQVATEALFHRTTPAAWWTSQKFEAGQERLRPTPYRYIEEHFLHEYFRDHLADADVLDIGCGTGYFTCQMARHARRVVGVDYNRDFIDLASRTWKGPTSGALTFEVGDLTDLSKGDPAFARQRYDFVVLIDTFLFLFDNKYQPELYSRRDVILRNLRQLLRPDGLLLVMDPHPLWLTPWLGHPEAPFGILTEYRQRSFKVTPTLEELTDLLYGHGFRIRRVREPVVDPAFRDVDPAGAAFMSNVPQWWFLEIEAGAGVTSAHAAA
jgi:2-polyprenyl-3-methyl-5-hydroxy-6-metoxy-1,4-benzoquinol methylase